ncbi:MAG: cation diffusion facilitator family transporter [Holosporaceae bacterium]|jgi:ferrous-iron efflux pump FieF|nr:cation diffusion facilitator family transporter [Holosporaceae bacterium]
MFYRIKLVDNLLNLYFGKCSHSELAQKSVILGVITSVFLIITKGIAWMATDSISMQASVIDSILDALTSFLAYHALLFSSVSFDKEHNYGHEKVEGIMALFQCLLVIYSGIMVFAEAYETFKEPKPINNEIIGIIVMVISCVAVYQLVYFQQYVAEKTDSVLVKGDSLHYISDFMMNICIIISLVASKFFAYVDIVCGVAVGGYVLYSASTILKSAIIDLMDESLPQKTQEKITNTIISVAGVKRIKILKTRSAGMKKYVESRVLVDNAISLAEADHITSEVESRLNIMFEKIDVIIKAEPDQDFSNG